MAREYARTHISIAEDEDFENLTADAQWLYLRVMIPDPSLNHCGVIDWRPNRLVAKSRDMTLDRILNAAGELEERSYARFDLATEEALVRSYIRSDELLRNPKMAACVIKSYRATASKTLRAVVVSEVLKAHKEHPEFSSWTHKDTAEDLSKLMARPSLEVVVYTNQIANAEQVQNTNAIPNEIGNRNTNPDPDADYLSRTGPDSLHLATNTLHHSPRGGYVPGEPHQGDDPANDPPPTRCPKHIDDPTDAPCRACGVAREDREAWELARVRRDADARSKAAHAAAEARALAIANCDLCDEDGYRAGRSCKHDPDEDNRAARGMAMVRAALAKGDQS